MLLLLLLLLLLRCNTAQHVAKVLLGESSCSSETCRELSRSSGIYSYHWRHAWHLEGHLMSTSKGSEAGGLRSQLHWWSSWCDSGRRYGQEGGHRNNLLG